MKLTWKGVLTYFKIKCYDVKVKEQPPCPYAAIGEDTLPGSMKF
jgi:hypothetical protein